MCSFSLAQRAALRIGTLAFLVLTSCLAHGQEAAPTDSLLEAGYAALAADEVAAAAQSFERAVRLDPDRVPARQGLAYALLALDRLAEAQTHFEAAERLAPGSVAPADLGHLYYRRGQMDAAATQFEAVLAEDPDNAAIALQLAYVYVQQDDRRAARQQFIAVDRLDDPVASPLARAELEAMEGRVRAGVWTAELYAAPLYQERFDVATVPIIARVGVVVHQGLRLQMYGSLRATGDTRSTGGPRPQIFSENVLVGALGVRARPSVGSPTFYIEAGPAVSLVRREPAANTFDLRGGAFVARRWDEGPAGALVGELYADASYYSRYEDVIAYAQARPGLRLLAAEVGTLDAYAALGAVADTRGRYFNNVAEAGAGLRWSLPGPSDLSVRAELVRGWQTVTGGAPTDTYGDARVFVVYSRFVRLSR